MRLKIENQLLEEKIHLLKTSSTDQVRYLKEEFGYVQPGEYIYRFEKEKKPSARKKDGNKSQTTDSVEKSNPNG
jgi:hypothetical protein